MQLAPSISGLSPSKLITKLGFQVHKQKKNIEKEKSSENSVACFFPFHPKLHFFNHSSKNTKNIHLRLPIRGDQNLAKFANSGIFCRIFGFFISFYIFFVNLFNCRCVFENILKNSDRTRKCVNKNPSVVGIIKMSKCFVNLGENLRSICFCYHSQKFKYFS